jgi:hypothetical protein
LGSDLALYSCVEEKNGCIGATLWQKEKGIKKIVREAGKWHYLPTIAGNH